MTNSTGAVTGTVAYGAYGEILAQSGNASTPFLFNGNRGVQADSNRLYYNRARFCHPALRSWLNADPAGLAGGLNLYAYAGGNPINFVDPSGLLFGIGVSEAYNYWTNVGGDAVNRGGILGALEAASATAALVSIDFFGARTLEKNAELAGRASAYGCTGKELKYGGFAAGQIALVAGGQYAVNAVLFPFIRFVGPGSAAGFDAGTWLARGTIGETPYGTIENATSGLQIPPVSEVDSAVNATSNVWYKYVAGPRTVSGNAQWGAGGGQEYRVGGFKNP